MRTTGLILPSILLFLPSLHAQFGDVQHMHTNGIHTTMQAVEVHDLDADGIEDLLLTTYTGIGYALGQSDGTWSDYEPIPGCQGLFEQVLLEDFDGDGRADLFHCRREGDSTFISMHINSGGLSFGEEVSVHRMRGSVTRFEIHDLDGDGDKDLVMTTAVSIGSSQLISRDLVWKRNDGPPPFGWGNSIHGSFSNSNSFEDFALVDVDGDADRDIVVCGSEILNIWRVDGPGLFTNLGARGRPGITYFQAHAADLDGDGDQDILVHNTEGTDILRNDGTGNFTNESPGALIPTRINYGAYMIIDDVDMDGDQDLVVSGRWHENDGTGHFPTQHGIWPLLVEPAALSWNSAYGKDGLGLVDPDGDGDHDLIVVGSVDGQHTVLFNNAGSGPIGPPTVLQPRFVFSTFELFTIDLDADGTMDALSTSGAGFHWFRGSPGGGFETPRLVCAVAGYIQLAHLTDMDQDGNPDLLYHDLGSGRIMLARSEGGTLFATPVNVTTIDIGVDEGLNGMYVADLDGDGDMDILVQEHETPVQLFLNEGTGSFGAGTELPDIGTLYDIIAVADMNGDGAADLVSAPVSFSGWTIKNSFPIHTSDGAGGFTTGDSIHVFGIDAMRPVIVDDLDGDGAPDLIFKSGHHAPWPVISWVRNEGNGQWSAPHPLVHATYTVGQLEGLQLTDVNGDGLTDLLFKQSTDDFCELMYAERLGGATFGLPTTIHRHEEGSHYWHDIHIWHPRTMQVLDDVAPNDVIMSLDGRPVWAGNFSATPYQVRGRVFHDADLDGTYDPEEEVMPLVSVEFTPESFGSLAFDNGGYTLLGTAGTYTVNSSSILDPTLWQVTTPASYTTVLTVDEPTADGLNFGFAPLIDTSIVDVLMMQPEGPCGGPATFWVHLTNRGTRVENGSLHVTFDNQLTPDQFQFVPAPTTVSGSTFTWDLSSLSYMAHFGITGRVVLPSVSAMGDQLTIDAELVLDGPGATQDTIRSALAWTLTCAYDPNDKQVVPAGYGAAGAIPHTTEDLLYTIRFQNTGTATAYHVVLEDELPEQLDRSSLELAAYSHRPTTITVDEDRLLTVSMLNIMLRDSGSSFHESQGFVTFRTRVIQPATHLTTISNTAGIIFDFNAPIITNTTLTTLVDCATWVVSIEPFGGDALQTVEGDTYQWYMDGEPLPGATERWLVPEEAGAYSVEVTSALGCTALSAPYIATSAKGTADRSGGLSAYPNPFGTFTVLHWDRPLTKDHTIVVCDVQGRIQRSFAGHGTLWLEIPREGMATGIYTVRILSGHGPMEAMLRLVVE